MPDEEAVQRREELQELREKFLVSRKHRLMGKPYQRPSPTKRKTLIRKESAAYKKPAANVQVGPGMLAFGANREASGASVLSLAAGLNPHGLLRPPIPGMGMSALGFAPPPGAPLLGQANNPLAAAELRQHMMYNRMASLRGSLMMNPSLMDQRSLLLGQGLGGMPGGYLGAQDLARHSFLAQIRSEDERSALLQQVAGVPLGAEAQEEKFDLASQLRATLKRPKPDAESDQPSPPAKKRASLDP